MPGFHADKARRGRIGIEGRSEGGWWWGGGSDRDQGSKPDGYTRVDNMSLMLLMYCPTGALAGWRRAQRSSTGYAAV